MIFGRLLHSLRASWNDLDFGVLVIHYPIRPSFNPNRALPPGAIGGHGLDLWVVTANRRTSRGRLTRAELRSVSGRLETKYYLVLGIIPDRVLDLSLTPIGWHA